ncbi:MAG: hypothetical protein K1X56_01975 [Flavobacteriales bacterium]|nr:hypothetical protein [Flavobacteriales bacterium]
MGFHPKVVFILFFMVIHSTLYSQSDTLKDENGDRYILHTENFSYKWPYVDGHVPSFIGISGSVESFKYPVYSIGIAYSVMEMFEYSKFFGIIANYKTDKTTNIRGWDLSLILYNLWGMGLTYGRLYYLENSTGYLGLRIGTGASLINLSITHRFFNWEKNKIPDLHHTAFDLNLIIPVARLSPRQSFYSRKKYIDEY